MSLSDPARLIEKDQRFDKSNYESIPVTAASKIDLKSIRKKQRDILLFKIFGVSSLVAIPIVINNLSRSHEEHWPTTAAVAVLGVLSFILYRRQSKLRFQIESVCHQLGPGVKLRKKYLKDNSDLYLIFQEGHRYYYIRSLQTGEKRLVPKDKILQDYDLAG